ncbi:uncharacterized protein LOC135842778 [Planococcus citri]|uniref:uncharacterized protein LOC135842778 n=1 Tax=Planococcus citri TaxID=170843 RepID=UPI0031F7741B
MPANLTDNLIDKSEPLMLDSNERQVKFIILKTLRQRLRVKLELDNVKDYDCFEKVDNFDLNSYQFTYEHNNKSFLLDFLPTHVILTNRETGEGRAIFYDDHPLYLLNEQAQVVESDNTLGAVARLYAKILGKFGIEMLTSKE